MRIEFYGIYRHLIGNKTIGFDLPKNSTVFDALQAVAQRFPALHTELFDQNNALYSYLPLYINGRNPRLLVDGLHTKIESEDVLSIFSPISSGRINVENARNVLSD